MRNQKGITLITLVITIVILIIITGVVTYSGLESVNISQKTAFISELEMIQAKVNVIYEERKASTEKIEYYNSIGQDISNVDGTRINEVLGQTSKDGFKFFNQDDLKKLDLDNINQEVLINYDTREVVSLNGFTVEGVKYYKLKDIPDYLGYNVDYIDSNTQVPDFTVSQTKLGENEYRFKIENIIYDNNVNGGTVKYKKHSETNWILNGKNTSFIVKDPGLYDICLTDNAGNSTIVQKWIYVENGLMCYLDGANNTKKGYDETATIWEDLTENGYNAKLYGPVWEDNNLKFNGIDNYAIIDEMNYENITIETVVNIADINQKSSYIGNHENGGYCLQCIAGKPRFSVYIDNSYHSITGNNENVEKVYYNSGSYDNKTIRMYQNQNKFEQEYIGNIGMSMHNTSMALGANPYESKAENEYFKGKIYIVRIYNRALTDEEIKTNYEIDKYRFGITE